MTCLCHRQPLSRNAGEGIPLRCCRDAAAKGKAIRAALAHSLKSFLDLEGEFDRLAGVEARVAMRQVVGGEALLADLLSAANAFGDVLAGQFEMHAAGIAALGEVDCEG